MADALSGIQVIDISDPTNPTYAGGYDTPDYAIAVAIAGDYAYVADRNGGLIVLDISSPGTPTYAGGYNPPGGAWGVAVSGDYACVGGYTSGLHTIDISDPTTPALLGTCDTPHLARAVAIAGDHAYVADYYSGLQVIDISDLSAPVLLGGYDTPDQANGVAVAGEYAFVADNTSGLQVIRIAYPVNPTLAGTCSTPAVGRDVAVSGDHAFLAHNNYGLQVIDISDPASPALAGSYDTPGLAGGVTVSGDHAFVADWDYGLQVIDISDPASPTLAGTCDTPGGARGVAVSGDHAFVADWDYGLQVIDISDPVNPTIVGTYDTPGTAYGVTVSGDLAYVADASSGLQVIDISDPTNPTFAGACNTPGSACGVAVSGDHAYVADDDSLQVVDISDPTNPTLVGSCWMMMGTAYDVTVSGDHAFVADWDFGLQVIDISDPASPALAGTCFSVGEARGVAVSGDHAFATGPTGLIVIQVFQSEVDPNNNIGRSLFVDTSDDTVLRARLTATQAESVDWELSADGGANWQGIMPDGSWNQLADPGTDLLWRTTHTWVAPGVNPGVTQLGIDWLYEGASIDSIVDMPDDQGGWVLAHFTRSGRDFSDEATLPISYYGIWRRVEIAALIAALAEKVPSAPEKSAARGTPDLGDIPVITYQGKTYLQSRADLATASFPPGTWMWVATVPAVQHDTYMATVPTAADSSASGTNHSVFVMTAHTTTPSIWYVSDPDSGYSVDNIAPGVPEGFAVAYNTGSGNELVWDECPDEDFQYFRIYRSSDPNFVPSPAELVHSLSGTNWNDPEYDGWDVYYKITALDHVGNESGPASPGTVTATEQSALPQTYGLYPNVPNPFNPSTSIRYDIPVDGGAVTLRIYDASGRLVRTLVNGPQVAGEKTVVWNGRDDRGRGVVSGVYFYRLQAQGYNRTMKMILIR